MSITTIRWWGRWVHLALAVAVALAIYSPLAQSEAFMAAVKFVLFPGTGLAGIAMWQAKRIAGRTARS